jgi:hypothetical protein
VRLVIECTALERHLGPFHADVTAEQAFRQAEGRVSAERCRPAVRRGRPGGSIRAPPGAAGQRRRRYARPSRRAPARHCPAPAGADCRRRYGGARAPTAAQPWHSPRPGRRGRACSPFRAARRAADWRSGCHDTTCTTPLRRGAPVRVRGPSSGARDSQCRKRGRGTSGWVILESRALLSPHTVAAGHRGPGNGSCCNRARTSGQRDHAMLDRGTLRALDVGSAVFRCTVSSNREVRGLIAQLKQRRWPCHSRRSPRHDREAGHAIPHVLVMIHHVPSGRDVRRE